MATIHTFEELKIWQDSRALVSLIYNNFSKNKDFSFRDQIQRASISIMNNIAEGFERESDIEFKRFLIISKASCGEVRSMIYVAYDIKYIDENTFKILHSECVKLSSAIQNLIKYLHKKK